MVNSLFASQVGDSGTERSHLLAHLGLTGPICPAEKHNGYRSQKKEYKVTQVPLKMPLLVLQGSPFT